MDTSLFCISSLTHTMRIKYESIMRDTGCIALEARSSLRGCVAVGTLQL